MQTMILLIIVFIILLLAPIVGAVLYYKTKQSEILHINQERVRDARYFGRSFASLVENHLGEISGNQIQMSRKEEFIDGDKQEKYDKTPDKLVICRRLSFSAPAGIEEFQKEIYGANNITLNQPEMVIRAAYSRGDVILGDKTEIVRWVDAEGTVAVYDDCNLGISVSSKERISIGENCSFQRLYAPEICMGQYPGEIADPTAGKDKKIYSLPIEENKERNKRYINKEMINEDGVVDFSILSWKNLIITEKIIVQGDVRSHKGVRLCDGAVVCGNVFAEGNVILDKNACVLGNVFTQESIFMEDGAVIGQRGRISSAIARESITAKKNTFIFGYARCEKGGMIVPKSEAMGKENSVETPVVEKDIRAVKFLEKSAEVPHITFENLYHYEHVDRQGFRFCEDARTAEIPEGALTIPNSMFFHCSGLKKVTFPATVQHIGDYGFADCTSLAELVHFEQAGIKAIGTSAFENCNSLKRIIIPASVENIDGAAFACCTQLEEVVFEEGSRLVKIGDHGFRGCTSLKKINIPENVQIGVSAFLECGSLENDKQESDGTENANPENDKLESASVENDKLESDNLESDNLESDNVESDNVESASVESDNLEGEVVVL